MDSPTTLLEELFAIADADTRLGFATIDWYEEVELRHRLSRKSSTHPAVESALRAIYRARLTTNLCKNATRGVCRPSMKRVLECETLEPDETP